MESVRRSRYSSVAIWLHWLIGVAILANIPIAWWMTDNVNNPDQAKRVFEAYQLHKSVGLTVLVLTLVRLAWRITHRPPPLPADMRRWERIAARGTHVLLYVVMIMLPLTGWGYVSAGWNTQLDIPFPVPTLWFGLFEWPHLPFAANAPDADRAGAAAAAMETHELLAWLALGLVALHALAALKHHFFDKDDVLATMLPVMRRRTRA